MNKNIVIIGVVLLAAVYCCTFTNSSSNSISQDTSPKKDIVYSSPTPYEEPPSNNKESFAIPEEQINGNQEPQQQTNYPICSQVKGWTSTTCIIEKAYCSYQPKVKGKPTFCNDAPYPKNVFTYLVWGVDLSNLSGHCIIVSGKVVLYKGKPEIEAKTNSGYKGSCD
jgi:hypothetical protein